MTTQSPPISGRYAADPIHSNVGFAVKYMGVSTLRGTFGAVSAKLEGRPDGVALTGAAEVESISIRTPEQLRAHVLGEQFFAADAHPQITFTASDVMLGQDAAASVDGALTIKGTTRPVTAQGTWSPPVADPTGKTRSHLALQATLNRRDYGITWDAPLPNGGSALADEVAITVELALVAQK
ncbi:MAG: YceI family protein [Actinomycetota bacterium]|nr:YceI family protein [Actinomycetota bacterium]